MALLLMVGFYALALGISGALLWVPYAEMTYLGRIQPKLALACIIGAGGVLWAIRPRRDRFEPPGPRLTRTGAPALFTLIERIAQATSQSPPEEVYLLNSVNAFVSQRGGVMGLGSRRVMGVGFPLLAHLPPAELAAVIAHEFGHYVSGDVGLGPWIYKTRTAIARSVAATDNTWLAMPFRAYAWLFLKTTLAVSREQEFVADRTAARIAGPVAAANALGHVATLAPAYAAYLESEVRPLVQAGFLPPVAAGFREYLEEPRVAALIEKRPAASDRGDDDAFDTHPPIAERIATLEAMPDASPAVAIGAAGPALGQPDQHMRALMRHALGEAVASRLRPIDWTQVGDEIYARRWHHLANEYASWLGTRTIDDLPSGRAGFVQAGASLVGEEREALSAEEWVVRAVHVFTAGVGSALLKDGWTIETAPGRPPVLVKDGHRLDPGLEIARLASGKLTEAEWRGSCTWMGIAGVPLSSECVRRSRRPD